MISPRLTHRRLVSSVLIAGAVSLLPIALPFLSRFFWLPGSSLGLMLFGPRMLLNPFIPVRVIGSGIVWWMLLYFGPALWTWGQTHPTRQSPTAAKYAFLFWAVLLIPWLLVAPLAVMAFDAGYTAKAYVVAWSVWTYPITVGIVAVCRRWMPWIVLLPLLNIAGCTVGS
jgi:hypothetical protein